MQLIFSCHVPHAKPNVYQEADKQNIEIPKHHWHKINVVYLIIGTIDKKERCKTAKVQTHTDSGYTLAVYRSLKVNKRCSQCYSVASLKISHRE